MKFCETKEDFINYAIRLYEQEEAFKRGDIGKPIDIDELLEHKEPVQTWIDGEVDYRRGFCHGLAYAVELIDMLHRKGYVRAYEISTIIDDFLIHDTYGWRYKAEDSIRDGKWRSGHPVLKVEPWNDLRAKVFARDNFRCVWCGSKTNLQCDHVEPCRSGGMPKMDNLQTLCADCNRKKG